MSLCKCNFLSLTLFFLNPLITTYRIIILCTYFREFQLMLFNPDDCSLLSNQNIVYNCVKSCHNIAIILISICVRERERCKGNPCSNQALAIIDYGQSFSPN